MKIVIEISEGTYSAVVSDYWCGDPIFRQAIINGQIIPTYNIEPCRNAIDRDEAIRVASGYCHPANVAKELAKLPPVTPEPKMGRWIMPVQDDGMSEPIYYQVRCSKCGFDLDPQTWHQELHQYDADKYCPKCGSYNGGAEK